MTARRRALATLAALPTSLTASPAFAEDTNPFAKHKLVLQLSDTTPESEGMIISVANSVLKKWPDTAAIDVVAFGPGVELLFAASPKRPAVDSLASQGVRFEVCMNTINTIARRTGHAPELNPHVFRVDYGVPRIMQLVSEGYVLVRP